MKKSKNQRMTTIFTWLGLIGGILTIISLTGYRFFSGKAKKDDEKKATEQREEIRNDISKGKVELFDKIDGNSTVLLNALELNKKEIIENNRPMKAEPPKIEFAFVHPNNLSYLVKNTSKKTIAENVLVGFGVFDLDISQFNPVPIPTSEINYINPNGAKGPWNILGNHAIENHRYFGILYLECKGCSKLKTYWIYFELNNNGNSFYIERNDEDTFEIQIDRLAKKDNTYFNSLLPEKRRIYIK